MATLELVPVPSIFVRDPLLRFKKRICGVVDLRVTKELEMEA